MADLVLKQAMIRAASHVHLVPDSTKIYRPSHTPLSPLDDVDTLITDDGISGDDLRAIEAGGVKVMVAR